MTARLPNPGGDAGNWGKILNDYLRVEHNTNGTLKNVIRLADLATKADRSELDGKANISELGTAAALDKGAFATAQQGARADTAVQPDALVPLVEHVESTGNPHRVTKVQVGLGDVPNVNATDRSNHIGTQAASTISDFMDAVEGEIEDAIENKNILVGVPGKNLFNDYRVSTGRLLNSAGDVIVSALYDTSDYIPVKVGQPYTFSSGGSLHGPRTIVFYDSTKALHTHIDNTGSQPATTRTPAVDGFARVSYRNVTVRRQVEKGTLATAHEPYRLYAPMIRVYPDQVDETRRSALLVEKSGEDFVISSVVGGKELKILTRRHEHESNSGLFNIRTVDYGGARISNASDDATPIRANGITLGANHGYTSIASYTVTGHGKTQADLGSVYSDGNREFTLLIVLGDELVFGGPVNESNGINYPVTTKPAATLVHVSGGTDTASVPIVTTGSMTQLRPIAKKVTVRFDLDGREITDDGLHSGSVLRMVESYEIPDWGELISWARTHLGQSYIDADIPGLVRIGNVYTYRSEGRCTVSSTIIALRRVYLADCGFLQANHINMGGHTTWRYLPGVNPIAGWDFSAPVNISSYNSNNNVTPGDLADADHPPSVLVDWIRDEEGEAVIGFAIGYVPDKTDSKDETRKNLSRTWDMRSTKKIYPVAISGVTLEAGDFRVVEGFRNFIASHPGGATVVNVVEDEAETYVHIDFHRSVTAEAVPLPYHVGKSVSVYYSDGMDVLNDVVSADGLLVTVAGDRGRAIVKLT